jgi:hypothetical protein
MIAKIIAARSANDPRLIAERIPIGIPRRSQITAAPIASVAVIGIRRLSSSRTGSKLPYEKYTWSLSHSPGHGTNPFRNRQYWM